MSVCLRRVFIIVLICTLLMLGSCNSAINEDYESVAANNYSNKYDIDQTTDISLPSEDETFDAESNNDVLIYDDVLGLGSCYIERIENYSLGIERLLFVKSDDGRIIADFGRWLNISDDEGYFFIDINGDGISELICNSQSADGAERVIVFQNNNGTIQCGLISEELILEKFNANWIDYPGALQERYDDSSGAISLTLYHCNFEDYEELQICIENLEMFDYIDYEYIE